MNDTSSDDILQLKQRLAEQEALNRALLEKLADREREIDHLQAQLDKLRRINFGSRSEKVSRRIAQMETDLNPLQKESDTLTGRMEKRFGNRFPDKPVQWLTDNGSAYTAHDTREFATDLNLKHQ